MPRGSHAFVVAVAGIECRGHGLVGRDRATGWIGDQATPSRESANESSNTVDE